MRRDRWGLLRLLSDEYQTYLDADNILHRLVGEDVCDAILRIDNIKSEISKEVMNIILEKEKECENYG